MGEIKAYLEKCDKEWFDDFVYTARQPLADRGIQIVGFDGTFLDDFIDRTSFNENDIVVGSVEATKAFWNEVGITIPAYLGYPEQLKPYLGRNIIVATFGEVATMEFPVFIKPKNDVKLFTGFLIESKKSYDNCKLFYSEITDDLEVYVSEPMDILSEYRCFVHKGELVGIKHYSGDFTVFPDSLRVQYMIANYKDSPVSYTLDVAVCDVGDFEVQTFLIEVNDFWAIGGYGLDGKTYTRMLIDRFQEIKNTSLK